MQGLGDCADLGLCETVGVSNFRPDRVRRAHAHMEARGLKLAANQVQYSLLYRAPERNGVLETCQYAPPRLPMMLGSITGMQQCWF